MTTIDERRHDPDSPDCGHSPEEHEPEPYDIDVPAVRPGRTHDGQRMRDTDTADVDRGLL